MERHHHEHSSSGWLVEEKQTGLGTGPSTLLCRHWQKKQADRKRGDTPTFYPGDRVWLSTKDLKNMPGSHKLNARFIGPYTILRQINPVTHKLQLPRYMKIHPSFYVLLLKRFIPGPLDEHKHQNQYPELRIINKLPAYTINKILSSHRRGNTFKHLIDSEGYGTESKGAMDPLLKLKPQPTHTVTQGETSHINTLSETIGQGLCHEAFYSHIDYRGSNKHLHSSERDHPCTDPSHLNRHFTHTQPKRSIVPNPREYNFYSVCPCFVYWPLPLDLPCDIPVHLWLDYLAWVTTMLLDYLWHLCLLQF